MCLVGAKLCGRQRKPLGVSCTFVLFAGDCWSESQQFQDMHAVAYVRPRPGAHVRLRAGAYVRPRAVAHIRVRRERFSVRFADLLYSLCLSRPLVVSALPRLAVLGGGGRRLSRGVGEGNVPPSLHTILRGGGVKEQPESNVPGCKASAVVCEHGSKDGAEKASIEVAQVACVEKRFCESPGIVGAGVMEK